MNDCERLSERMPEVAMLRSQWTAQEAAHLARCADCAVDWELVQRARALGANAPTIADATATATVVLRRLAEERVDRRRTRRAWSFAVAAAAAAAILVAVMTGRNTDPTGVNLAGADSEALVPLPELEGLETAQLDTLLQSIDRPVAAGTSTLDASTLGGDDEDGELERVFAAWEG